MSITAQYIIDDLRSEIIEPNPAFFSQDRMLNLINQAQDDYVRQTRVLQSTAFTSSVQGQADYAMPTDWLGAEEVFFNATTDGITPAWRWLEPTNLTKLSQESPNFLSDQTAVQGRPFKCYVLGHTLFLFPRPLASGVGDIFMFYESSAPRLTTLTDTLSIDDSLYPGVRAYVLEKLWRQDNEDAKADKQEAKYLQQIGLGRKWKNKRILDGRWKMDIASYIPYTYSGASFNSYAAGINPLNQ